MAEVSLSINGRDYGISCDDGQEQRVIDLGMHVDARLRDISSAGAASNESHLLVLTAIMLADEVFDLRDNLAVLGEHVEKGTPLQEDETAIAQTIEQLAGRIQIISDRIQKA